MNIKKITKNGWTLTHSWYIDDMGLQRNSFDLFNEETRTHYPFWGDIRVSNIGKGEAVLGDDISPYSDEEYEKMFTEQLSKRNEK